MRRIFLSVLLAFSINACYRPRGRQRHEEPAPSVCLEDGPCYKGSWMTTSSGTKFASFQAIRYGQAPLGELRFRSSLAFMEEAGATVDVSGVSEIMCPQYAGVTETTGQEDCLMLNIYVPKQALSEAADKRSVMVWIHGGGLTVGSNAMNTGDKYSPFPLLDRDVIVVAINYRLSYLGFMYMGTEAVPGNAGLRDQTLALRWIQDHIGQFGGDPGSVTLTGQSGGAWSVSYHLASPLSGGLFQRAILESGTSVSASSSPVSPERALRAKDIVAESVNCTAETDAEMLQCLQSVDAHDLVNALFFPTADAGYAAPVVDGGLGLPDPFLPDHTDQLFASGEFNKDIEVMIGTTKDESILFMMPALNGTQPWKEVQATFENFYVQIMFNIPPDLINEEDVAKAKELLEQYCGGVEDIIEENKQNFINLITDSNFLYGTHKQVNYLLEHSVTTYQYLLSYEASNSLTTSLGYPSFGVCHGDELQYIFEPSAITDSPLEGDDALVGDTVATAWTNFAKFGDPAPPGSEVTWSPVVTRDSHEVLDISGPRPGMTQDPEIDARMAIWVEHGTF